MVIHFYPYALHIFYLRRQLLLSATEPNNDWTAQRPIFERRHKWIISLPAKNSTRIPDFASFVAEATYLRRQPRDGLALIRCGVNFLDLLARSPNHGATSRWASGRDQVCESLLYICPCSHCWIVYLFLGFDYCSDGRCQSMDMGCYH